MENHSSNILNKFCHKDDYIYVLLKLSKYYPKNKSTYYFFILFKLLPLIVVTHDWNISSKLGVSFWIRKFTLAEYIADVHHIFIYYIIVFGLFTLEIIDILLFFNLKRKITFNGKLFNKYKGQLYFLALTLFYIFYAISQFYFSIFIENIFNDYSKKKNKIIYYFVIILETLITIFTLLITFLMGSIIVHEPFFINSLSPFLNELGSVDFFPFVLLINQIVVQLEFSLEFKYIFLVKAIIRGLYCLYYIIFLFNFNNYYYKYYFYYIVKLIQSCCFVSCVIEFIFCYDYSNELKILQKDNAIISIKLILEIICGILLNEIYFYIDNQKIREQVTKFSYKNIKTFNNKMIKFLNMIYYHQRPYLLKVILQELNFSLVKRIHNPLCSTKMGKEKCYYCNIYTPEKFTLQLNSFMNFIKSKNAFDYNSTKENFPLLFSFFENEIKYYKEINFSKRNAITPLFFVVTYIYAYERNFYKCLYILEKILSNKYIQNSHLSKYQITFFKHKLIKFFKNGLHNIIGKVHQITVSKNEEIHCKKILKFFDNFKCIERIFYVETMYKQFLVNYIKFMNYFNDELTCFHTFNYLICKFNYNYDNVIHFTNKLFYHTKCNYIYPVNKLYLFLIYFRNCIPDDIKKTYDKFFIDQLTSFIELKTDFYILVLKLNFLTNETSFKLNYATENLIQKLRYSNKEFYSLTFNEIYAKKFYKSYKYIFEKNLSKGIDFFKLNNLCLLDKNKYVLSFDLEAVPIYKKDGIELYFKLTEAKEQLLVKKNKRNSQITKNKYLSLNFKNNTNFNICGSSFLFSNKSGKIINLSRGFEDLFFLNTIVLDKYNINIMELLKIEKLDSKGFLKKNLLNIYDNLYDIYLREVGQLGEDPFSQVILQINEFKKNISLVNNNFLVNINYEEKFLMKDEEKKVKNYYLFVFTIYLEEQNDSFKTSQIIQMFQQQSSFFNQSDVVSKDNLHSVLNNFSVIEKNNENNLVNLSSKLEKIKNLSNLIIKQFYKIKTKIDYNENNENFKSLLKRKKNLKKKKKRKNII